MKKIYALVLVLCVMLNIQSAFAATYVFDDNFDTWTSIEGNEYVSFLAGQIDEINGNKYLKGDHEDKIQIQFLELPQTALIISADIRLTNISPEQFQIWAEYGNNWNGIVNHLYDCVASDTDLHSMILFFDPINSKTKLILDGELKVDSSFNSVNGWSWDADGAGLVISAYNMQFDNMKIAFDDISGIFGIEDIKFNDVELSHNNGDYGNISKELNKISVKFNYPIEDRTLAPIDLKNGSNTMSTSFVYNTETGYYDFTVNEDFEGGELCSISISDNFASLFGNKTYTFSIAENDYEFGEMSITTTDGTQATIEFTNSSLSDCKATVVLFVYDSNGMLIDCIAGETFNVAPTQTQPLSAQLETSYTEGYTVEAYVWDDVESAIPIFSVL